jgi:hypothetical protein
MLDALTAIRDGAGAIISKRLPTGRFAEFRARLARDPARLSNRNRRNSDPVEELEERARILSDGNSSTTPIGSAPERALTGSIYLEIN